MAAVKKPQEFDLKKFNSMNPPFRIRIERKDPRRGLWEPIPLPQDVWSKEDAERIEQIVLNDIAGGGHYKGAMIDSSGGVMEWVFAYNPEYFPAKIPPGSASALGAPAAAPAVAMPAIGGQSAAAPGWHPGFYGNPVSVPAGPAVSPYTPPQQPGYFGGPSPIGYPPSPYMPSPYMASPFAYQSPPAASTPRGGKDPEVDMLRQQMQAAQRQADEERHAREREAQAAAFREQLAAQQQKADEQIRQLREMMIDGQKRTRPEDDPAILAMKQQTEMLQKQMEDQRRQLEAERSENRHREEMRTLQENSQRQIDALKELIAKSTENKDDPQMKMLIELQRQQFDAQREANRAQAEASRDSTRLAAEQPRTMVEMMERLKAASGSEQMLNNIANAYKGVNDMQMQVMEMMANMGQSPGMALAEGALASGKDVLERFLGAKQAEAIAKQRTEQMKSQERAVAAQAQAQAYAASQAPYQYPDGSIKGQPPERTQLGSVHPLVDEDPVGDQSAPTEADIFGPLHGEVEQLRAAAAANQVTPAMVADVIMQAIEVIQMHDLTVPVFSLLGDERYADLIDLLLPGVPSEFAGECVSELIARLKDVGAIETGTPPEVDLDSAGGNAQPNDDEKPTIDVVEVEKPPLASA